MRQSRLGVVLAATLIVLAGCGGVVQSPAPAETPGETSTTAIEPTTGTLEIHKINVGQGSATLIVGPTGETILVDTGDWRDDGQNVLTYLKNRDIERIDHLVTSHADADHIGGHEAIIDYYETEANGIGAVYDPGIASSSQTYDEYLNAVERHNVTLYQTRAGDTIPLDGATVRVLAPPEGYIEGQDRNENSLVLRLSYGASSFLIPGDAETAGEEYLVNQYGDRLDSTVLNVGHHGSQSSSTADFLDVVEPRIAVISSGYDSQYGHPHKEVLQRLAARSIPTYWTGVHGDIRLSTNGSALTVATEQSAPTDATELRSGSAIAPDANQPLEVRTQIQLRDAPVTTDGGTATATEQPTTSAPGELSVATIHADAEGSEADNLNDEYLVFENVGGESLNLSGWTLADAVDHTYTFPAGTTLGPSDMLTVHTGSGTDTPTDLYWGATSAVWNNGGDTITVRDENGALVLEETYS